MPPTDRMNIITMTVFNMGMVMYRVCCHLLAPSSMAASYREPSMPVMVAR